MATRNWRIFSPRKILLALILSVGAVLTLWIIFRLWLITIIALSEQVIHIIDMGLVFVAGIVATLLLSQLMARRIADYFGATQGNAIRLLIQVLGFSIVFLILFSMTSINIVNALVGMGFLGIVVGLAAQTVLGNFFSGLMLLASRPFNISDRIALITWQYGKFPPSLSHGWLEPAYTGSVKEVTLMHTKILTDSNTLVIVPNGIVTQSLVLNMGHDKYGHIETQFEIPIHIDPDKLHTNLTHQISRIRDFKGEEERFYLVDVSPSAYLATVSYRVEKNDERDMKSLLLRALRLALISTEKSKLK